MKFFYFFQQGKSYNLIIVFKIKSDYVWIIMYGKWFKFIFRKMSNLYIKLCIIIIMYNNFENFKSKIMNKYWS